MSTNSRFDVYQHVTDTILKSLETGTAPWVKPWKDGNPAIGAPRNAVSEKAYRGINIPLLLVSEMANGFNDSRWMTYKQAQEMGGNVRKGEKGTQIVFWRFLTVEDKHADATGEEGPSKEIPFLRLYTVFNAAQCDGLPRVETPAPTIPAFHHARAAECFNANAPKLRHGGDRACYIPAIDTITLPPVEAFKDESNYWGTALHELTHWTGHESRLNRDLKNRFGSKAYAAEELIAEMGAAFLCASVGIEGKLQHAEYINNWIQIMKSDKRAIFTASSKAQQAADFILKASPVEVAEVA